MSNSHALLRPSAAHRWVHCPGSVLMEMQVPDVDSAASMEGTAAHWVASQMLAGVVVVEGEVTPNHTVVTAEMLECAEMYANHICDANFRTSLSTEPIVVEQRVSMATRIHAENWGTPDAWMYCASERVLCIWDFKYGHGFVDAFENWQLINYAAGILAQLGVNDLDDQTTRVIMTVVQPRNYDAVGPIRAWSVLASDLRPYFNQLEMAAEDALSGHAGTRPGPHCTHCRARHACSALQRDAHRSADLSGESIMTQIPPVVLGAELRMLEAAQVRLDARISGLRSQLESEVSRGALVPGWTMGATLPREKYTVPVADVIATAKLCGVDASRPDCMTPAQLRKAGVPDDVVASMSTRPAGVPKLIQSDSPSLRKIFDGFVK